MAVYSFKQIVSESYRVLVISVLIGLAAGYMLDYYSGQGRITAITLAMVPPLNGIGGNIGSILGARLSSALHLGTIEPKLRDQPILKINVSASLSLSLIVFGFAGIIFFGSSILTGKTLIEALKITSLFFGAGILLTTIITITSVSTAFLSYKQGIDPDNVVIPIVTTIVDVAGVLSLLIMTYIVSV